MFNILVVDDEIHIRKLMSVILKQNGYDVFCAENGEVALEIMDNQHIDLVVLDVMMPKMDGYKFVETLRQGSCDIPVLMVSAKQESSDKRMGFIAGTDDYMTKPVDEDEMLLRIKALLRRSNIAHQRQIKIGEVVLNYDSLTVKEKTKSHTLPPKEFYLLYKLLSNPDRIFTRYQILDEIWGMESETADNTVVVHINRLRKRFEDLKEFEIVTVRGLGYKGVKHEG